MLVNKQTSRHIFLPFYLFYLHISFYIYLIAWMLICDHWFHVVFTRQSGRKRKIEKSKKCSQRNVLELPIGFFCSVCVCVDYICVLLCVVVYVIVCVDTCAVLPILGCLMIIYVAMCSKTCQKLSDGWGFGQINFFFLLCLVGILVKGQSYYHHCIMKKINF